MLAYFNGEPEPEPAAGDDESPMSRTKPRKRSARSSVSASGMIGKLDARLAESGASYADLEGAGDDDDDDPRPRAGPALRALVGFRFKYGAHSKADSWHLTQHRVMEAPADPRRPSGSTAEVERRASGSPRRVDLYMHSDTTRLAEDNHPQVESSSALAVAGSSRKGPPSARTRRGLPPTATASSSIG